MGYGVDVSEHQRSFPSGDFEFAIVRLINENGREDKVWRSHYAAARERGIAVGAYGIIDPGSGVSARNWALHYRHLLNERSWDLYPVVDIELGNPHANVPYADEVNRILREQHPILMGYYSRDSAYRQLTAHMYDRQWIAAFGSRYPAGADIHQYQGHPLDLNWTPNLAVVSTPPIPVPPPEIPKEENVVLLATNDGRHFVVAVNHLKEIPADRYLHLASLGFRHEENVHPLVVVATAAAFGVEF